MKKKYKGISLFTGAGGMDKGFESAGVDIVLANEIDKDASATYRINNPYTNLIQGDLREIYHIIEKYEGADLVFGGPPCQGFSVAGKMDLNDERNKLVLNYLDVVNMVKPKAFVMENVKALGKLEKWSKVREDIINKAQEMGYSCVPIILNASEFGVPQNRERVFFLGFKGKEVSLEKINSQIEELKCEPRSVMETIRHLGRAGTDSNPQTCTAKVTFASNPVLRKAAYTGMIFNGAGRPINLNSVSNTLPASMGGNKTPIIDEEHLHGDAESNWVEGYFNQIINKEITPAYGEAPSRLRRLTVKEASLIQTFPEDYEFLGGKTAAYRQIGNAVPCKLAEAVAKIAIENIE